MRRPFYAAIGLVALTAVSIQPIASGPLLRPMRSLLLRPTRWRAKSLSSSLKSTLRTLMEPPLPRTR